MKKTALAALCLAATLFFGTGSALAETPLNSAVNSVMGSPYKWAGTTKEGFDCSGFTMYIFAQFGIELPHQSAGQAKHGTKVEKSELIPGDLVFFNTSGKGISHVGIYVGDGKFAHSATNEGIVIDSMDQSYYAKRYVTARRILSDEQYAQVTTEPPAQQ
ncbi:C40 family peptidase [Paenibacillus turpanensis]|uniref:C40 family peptidase n=1 Tax=Paenibacillus turpanensis TaxID=2689078 RepID=UPI001A9DCA58|nr:C40 family peptidase [Paenibacillus turpanensis]